MVKKQRFLYRLLFYSAFAAIIGGTIFGLIEFNEAMEIRYQAVGIVTDGNGKPIEGVDAILVLTPPPVAGVELDTLFRKDAVTNGRLSPDGHIKLPVGPVIGLSGDKGGFIVRTTGRYGADHAIRMGLDSSGKPPFEIAWLVLRKEGFQDSTMTVSLLGWREAPKDWGRFANRLPRIQLTP